MERIAKLKLVLWSITGLALAVGFTRFIMGLGSVTALTDAVPWGLWIGFDVMSGVALAAGGFVITAIYYIFKREEMHHFVRPAVLTAFLGYAAVVLGLLFDLGLPWNIWHMIVFWNPHSPLFEVGWCVMIYTAVLLLEFSPIPLEETSRYAKIRNTLLKARIPLVIAGISLSTLHQSSLGSLFLIMPYRVHPLWYSPILPILFFLSAIALGFLMVTFECLVTTYFYKRERETRNAGRLLSWGRWALLLYIVVRFSDLIIRGYAADLTSPGWQTIWFWVEIALAAFIPLILMFIPRTLYSHAGQWVIASFGVFGIALNRINVGGFAQIERGAPFYLPAWSEIAISAGVVSFMALVFLWLVEHLHIWECKPKLSETDSMQPALFDRASGAWLGKAMAADITKYSLAVVIAAGIGFTLLSGDKVTAKGNEPTPVKPARGGDTLWVDGDRDSTGVAFAHQAHIEREGKEHCAVCHHMNLPGDKNSACVNCHSDMTLQGDAFKHDWHSSPQGANIACFKCHAEGQSKRSETALKCEQCHKDMIPVGSEIKVEKYVTPSYSEAMHLLCIDCHKAHIDTLNNMNLDKCPSCHKNKPAQQITAVEISIVESK